jgi:hypothetical protein
MSGGWLSNCVPRFTTDGLQILHHYHPETADSGKEKGEKIFHGFPLGYYLKTSQFLSLGA